MKNYFFYLFLWCCCLESCTTIKSVTFIKKEQKKIALKQNFGFPIYCDFENKKPFIACDNDANTLFCYDFETGKRIQTIDVSRIGCNDIHSFQFKDLNTIVLTAINTKIYLIDTLGNLINSFDFKQFDPNIFGAWYCNANSASSYSSTICFVGNCMEIANTVSTQDSSLSRLDEIFMVSDYDGSNPLVRGRCNIRYHTNPALHDYGKTAGKLDYSSPNFVIGDTIYHSLFANDTLYMYNGNGYIGKTATKRSAFVEDLYADLKEIDEGYESGIRAELRRSGNVCFYYDKYRKLLYKLVEHSNKYYIPDSTHFNWTAVKEYSVMIFDKKFNYLNEISFPAKTYDFRNRLIITPKAIFISTDNEFNPEYKPDEFHWDKFKVKIKRR